MRTEQNKKKVRVWIPILIAVIVLGGLGAAGYLIFRDYSSRLYGSAQVEAGTEVVPEDFLKRSDVTVTYAEGATAPDTDVPGTYELNLKSGWFSYTCSLTVVDTTAPVAEPQMVDICLGETVSPEDFIKSCNDITPVTFAFLEEPDITLGGEQSVEIICRDTSGNETKVQTYLYVRFTERELSVEVGSAFPSLQTFLLEGISSDMVPANKIAFDENTTQVDMNVVGEYEILIRTNNAAFPTTLYLVDTIPPIVEVTDVEAYTTSFLPAEKFVTSVSDASEVTISYVNEPDMNSLEPQQIFIEVEDVCGNITKQSAMLTLSLDEEPPVLTGVHDIFVYVGNAVSYKENVKVTDNCDEDITFNVSTTGVDLSTPGEYPVSYTAVDKAGNRVVKEITVTVQLLSHSEEEIEELANQILATIIIPEMTGLQKLRAIYDWCHANISYTGHTDKDDWLKAAYEGMALRAGDCYAYACVAKALLNAAGIPNRDIVKIPTRTSHYWNLVDIGEGWYHFDTCPRKGHPDLCYLTDEELMTYSQAHGNSHNYDRTIYTDIE